ncbi:uncharacterized protein EDB91DRAFT_1064058 [Suillus paluster]|uniref:uncharacterized protein n=1 Tax=Suillus paluster TaxID=48578 RepID=UPI001B877389|nr:uncharacterized protein EDB91DRAFT_1064058 [Suillus paluster]KAG1722078.1 hypothetical protein EDB91DRAFT_1064058 [Suillus paluster]
MRKDNVAAPQELVFLSACRLPHGGILYELESPASALWFNTPANRSNFLERFGINIIIKERSFHVLVENVPILFTPNNPAATVDIKKKVGLKPGSIVKVRYIKPIARRNPGQRTAHTIFTFNSREDANQAIKFGLSVASKKVYGRKLIPEPTRCLKCHSFDSNHVVAEFPKEQDTCGTCGAQHWTAECRVDDPKFFYCSNCDIHGHTSWSREWPTFIRKWEAHKRRNEESKYRFFPTDDPLTRETTTDSSNNWHDPNVRNNNSPPPTLVNQCHPPPPS